MNVSTESPYSYQGQELDVFALAHVWKSYYSSFFEDQLKGRVLEVGAGIGANTLSFVTNECRWVALEPDGSLCDRLRDNISKSQKKNIKVIEGTVATLPDEEKFDLILYLDVLEHIQDDQSELKAAVQHLSPNGKLVILSPAHSKLFSEFDHAIGHLRRYDRESLLSVIPKSLTKKSLRYLDSAGAILSFANRLLLRQTYPSRRQILIWDRFIVRISKLADFLFNYRLGKSILGIWELSSNPRP